MTKQRRFTKEFEDEAVRLVATSGRTQREVAEDLGVTPDPAGAPVASITRVRSGAAPLSMAEPVRS
jgi:hypothetical protein